MAVPPSGFGDSDLRREDPLIFVSDASAEAERFTAALRARGYQVVDVPLTLLVGRVAVQRPALILCDVDAEGALETTHRLRDIPGGAGVDIIFIGEAGRTLEDMADAVFHEGSGFFVRPVDVFSLLHKAEALIGPPSTVPAAGSIVPSAQRGPVRISSHPPQRRTPSQPPDWSDARPPSAPPSQRAAERPPSNPPGRIVASASRSPSSPPSKTPSAPPARAPSSPPQLPGLNPAARGAERESAKLGLARQIPQAEISPELEQLLMRAEQRVGKVQMSAMSTAPPSFRLDPEAEVDAILPADVLAALDEPLEIDDDDDDESSASVGTRTGSEAGRTSSGTAASTAAGSTAIGGVPTMLGQRTASGTQGTGVPVGTQPPPPEVDAASSAAAPATSSGAEAMGAAQAAAVREGMESEPPPTPPAVPTRPPSAPSWLPPSSVAAEAAGVALHPAALAATTPPARPPAQDEVARAAATAADGAIRRMTEPSTTPPRGRDVPPTEPPVASDELDPSSEPALEIPATLGALDAFRALAKAIRSRYTGALAFEEPAGIRRVVLRDGDFVTAASGADAESLAAFLAGRGDLAPEAARQARKLPQFGRHAGAALIAHGHLRQDDLWPVLRAHAEWILGRIANMNEGSASVERQIPPRLQAEPAVFGGATGAEVLVEIARRTIGPDQAIRKLGGASAQFVAGTASRLLGECALPDAELALVDEAKTTSLSDLLGRAQAPEFASVLFALLELGVLALAPGRRIDQKPARVHDELDDEALRTRILTRKALVDDGDYFALLGVGRAATAYDIRRAYATLRREFEPSRVLGAKTADLRDDVDLILEVLEEAYEILKDERRRDRYRRALEANPSGRP